MKNRHRSSDASRRYHDRVARKYDAIYDDPYWEFHDRLTWHTVRAHLPVDATAHCCDLGCGTGKWGMKLLKSGFATTFVDQSAAMIEQTRAKLQSMSSRAEKATLLVGDIVSLPQIAAESFALILAMGDPLSICSDAQRAVREMRRMIRPGGVVIATADNKLAAIDHFMEKSDIDGLESFLKTGRTQWLTNDDRERFDLHAFTSDEFCRLFERAGFEVVKVTGKTILPVRAHKDILQIEGAFERLLEMEIELAKDAGAAARAAHLQIVARAAASGPPA
jgi:ubiquinone/menaquinone biosynthesis C-methylase UbiE